MECRCADHGVPESKGEGLWETGPPRQELDDAFVYMSLTVIGADQDGSKSLSSLHRIGSGSGRDCWKLKLQATAG